MENIIANLIALAIRKHEAFILLSDTNLSNSCYGEYLGAVEAVAVAAGVDTIKAIKVIDEVMYA